MANTKHTRKEIVMLIKHLCRVSENYDYLNSSLPHEFFLDFISHFYRIFKEHIDKSVSFRRFVSEQFTDSLELYVNPQSNLNADNKTVTIHEEFLHRNYPKLSKFAARFDEWAKYEEDDKIKQIAMADNLTREQRVNRNLVKEYQDRCNDSLLNSVIHDICLENANLQHDNNNFVENIKAYDDTNELMKQNVEDLENKMEDYDEKIAEMDDKYKTLDGEHKKLKVQYKSFELRSICTENEYKFKEYATVAELKNKIVDLEKINDSNLRELENIKQQLNEELKRQKNTDEKQQSLLANLKEQKKEFEITLRNEKEIIKEEEKSKRQTQLNLIAEKQISNELMTQLKQKTNELEVLSGQLKTKKVLKDTQHIHDLQQKLFSSKQTCEKARSDLVQQQKRK